MVTLKFRNIGIDYRDMQLRTSFDNNIISLDTLGIRSSDGKMTGGGKVSFKSELYKGDVQESTIQLKFDKFNPINHKQVNMQLSGQMHLDAQKDFGSFRWQPGDSTVGDLPANRAEYDGQSLYARNSEGNIG